MRIYIGFDDTDILGSEFGTGKLVRRFEQKLPAGYRVWGVVRQQLLVDPAIPYTSHNSSACMVVDVNSPSSGAELIALAALHLERTALAGSDPGLCLAAADQPALAALRDFGLWCTARIVTQDEARRAAAGAHLSSHGGTGDGIIGAAAAVGLTASGWSGRFIEFSGLRNFPATTTVGDLARTGIRTVSLDRDAFAPRPDDRVDTKGWLRPRLWGGQAVLPVNPVGPGLWEIVGGKRNQHKTKKKED
ncbi:MAG: hypothetical protein K4445_02620 [Deltaproteobacteria bacterium]|jgi:tRNA(Ile2) C34 agmatinyltransferase TiaS|nr:hypothetical protein [Syntrophaceae bacterium]